jgi:hypothetical protein
MRKIRFSACTKCSEVEGVSVRRSVKESPAPRRFRVLGPNSVLNVEEPCFARDSQASKQSKPITNPRASNSRIQSKSFLRYKISDPHANRVFNDHNFAIPDQSSSNQDVDVVARRSAHAYHAILLQTQYLGDTHDFTVEFDLDVDRDVGQVCDFLKRNQDDFLPSYGTKLIVACVRVSTVVTTLALA